MTGLFACSRQRRAWHRMDYATRKEFIASYCFIWSKMGTDKVINLWNGFDLSNKHLAQTQRSVHQQLKIHWVICIAQIGLEPSMHIKGFIVHDSAQEGRGGPKRVLHTHIYMSWGYIFWKITDYENIQAKIFSYAAPWPKPKPKTCPWSLVPPKPENYNRNECLSARRWVHQY